MTNRITTMEKAMKKKVVQKKYYCVLNFVPVLLLAIFCTVIFPGCGEKAEETQAERFISQKKLDNYANLELNALPGSETSSVINETQGNTVFTQDTENQNTVGLQQAVYVSNTGNAEGSAVRSGGESLASLSSIRSGRGVFIGELNPVNYKTVDPAILLQMGMEQYQVSYIMGERYLNERNYDRALAEYNRAINLKSDYAEAFFSRGRTYQIKGDLSRALEDYNRTINLKKDSAAAFNYRGFIYAQRGDHTRALSDYNQAIALQRDYPDALYNRGYSYRLMGQYDRAIEDFNRLIQIEPNNASAYNQRGTAWYYKENDERAIQDFSAAIRIKPDYALAWHNRGTAHRMAGNTTAANADFTEAKRLGYK